MNKIRAVTLRELRAYFHSPIAYVFLLVFVGTALFTFFNIQAFFFFFLGCCCSDSSNPSAADPASALVSSSFSLRAFSHCTPNASHNNSITRFS